MYRNDKQLQIQLIPIQEQNKKMQAVGVQDDLDNFKAIIIQL